MVRGGSWNNDNPENLRAAYRNNNNPDNRNNNVGFRVGARVAQHSLKGVSPLTGIRSCNTATPLTGSKSFKPEFRISRNPEVCLRESRSIALHRLP